MASSDAAGTRSEQGREELRQVAAAALGYLVAGDVERAAKVLRSFLVPVTNTVPRDEEAS